MFRLIWLCLAGFAAFTAAHVSAALPARPSGPILDAANVIAPADEAALDAKLRAYNQSTGRAIIVATVPSLDGEDVQEYARNLAETWGIGGKESENGVLFLVAPNEHKMWISTARGVQDRLTDIMAGRIYRDVIVPRFKQGDISGGIVAGSDAIIAQLDMDPAQAKAIEEAEIAAQKNHHANPGPAIGLFFVFLFFFVIPFIAAMSRRGGKGYKRSGFGSAVGNIALWTALNAASNAGRSGGGSSWGGGGFSGGGGGGFGGFGGGGGGFNGGGAGGGW